MDSIPTHLKPQKSERGNLFKSKFMESATRTTIEVPMVMHTLIALGFLWYAYMQVGLPFFLIVVLFLSGVLSWTFTEYVVHRWGYHSHTNLKWLLKIQHMAHGIHHQHPRDTDRLAMPPLPALVLITLFFGLFWMMGGTYAIAFFPGFLIGYMLYIGLHYAQHRYKAPRFKPLNRLWRHHALHHYKYPETRAFGVSTRLWDLIFGTLT